MKKYIGTKHIEAEPMTMGEAYEKGLLQACRVPSEEEKDNAGYHVKYSDNYESWSPAEPFEKAYKCAETALDRLNIEYEELLEKIYEYHKFIDTEEYKDLVKDKYSSLWLSLQIRLMERYESILDRRIEAEKGETNITTPPNMSFTLAIGALKCGLAIRRKEWTDKGLFVVKQVPALIDSDIIPKMQSLPQYAKDLIMKGKRFIRYTDQCLIYNENTGRADSWSPSVSDIFADDWEIVQ